MDKSLIGDKPFPVFSSSRYKLGEAGHGYNWVSFYHSANTGVAPFYNASSAMTFTLGRNMSLRHLFMSCQSLTSGSAYIETGFFTIEFRGAVNPNNDYVNASFGANSFRNNGFRLSSKSVGSMLDIKFVNPVDFSGGESCIVDLGAYKTGNWAGTDTIYFEVHLMFEY